MKRFFLTCLIAVLCFSISGCSSDEDALRIATAEFSGNFMDGFGASDYDLDIMHMINGYDTYDYNEEGDYVLNKTSVAAMERVEHDNKDVTYTYHLQDDLTWSDQTKLTAKDYVFSILFTASDEWKAVGASDTTYDHVLGFDSYYDGLDDNGIEDIVYLKEDDDDLRAVNETGGYQYDEEHYQLDEAGNRIPIAGVALDENGMPVKREDGSYAAVLREKEHENGVLKGVHLKDDTTFSVTLDGSQLPYYQEETLVSVTPLPMHVFTNGKGDISCTDEGCSLIGYDLEDAAVYAKNEYRKSPTVVSGPYLLESYQNKMITLKRNHEFKGDFRGNVPEIETVVVKEIDPASHVDALLSGEVDLISNIKMKDDIKKAKEAESIESTSFLSSSYGMMSFACDFGATADVHVRRAIAYALDRNELIATALGGYGQLTLSDYGYAQWMYKERSKEIDAFDQYAYNLEHAKAELNQSAYIYEADGKTPYDASKAGENYLRYNDKKEPLEIHHLGVEGNEVTSSIELQLLKNLPKLGIRFTVERADFSTLMTHYYNGFSLPDNMRKYHSFNMAAVLYPGYEPFYNYHSMFAGSSMNPSGIQDQELDQTMEELMRTPPDDKQGYLDAWVAYEKRFHDVLPVLPLYASEDYVFYHSRIKHVNVNALESYGHVISAIRWNK